MAKDININLSLGRITKFFTGNVEILFAVMLLGILVLEGFVVKSSIDLIQNAKPQPGRIPVSGVKVNFKTYDAVTQKIDTASTFVPPIETIFNPFTPEPATPSTPK